MNKRKRIFLIVLLVLAVLFISLACDDPQADNGHVTIKEVDFPSNDGNACQGGISGYVSAVLGLCTSD